MFIQIYTLLHLRNFCKLSKKISHSWGGAVCITALEYYTKMKFKTYLHLTLISKVYLPLQVCVIYNM